MPATVSKPIPRLFSLIFFLLMVRPIHEDVSCKYKSILFSIWPPVAVNIHYFLVHAIDGLGGGGGGSRRNTHPRMLDAHQAVPTSALRPTESSALSQDPNGRGRGNRGTPVWMKYVDRPPGTLRQTPHRTPHHRVLLRIIGAQCKRPDHRMTSYNRALEITRCESIETTLRTRRLLWAGRRSSE